MDEFDFAGGTAEFLEQEDLVGVSASEPIRTEDSDDIELALAGGVTESVEGRAVEA
ncbi:hypothetical protein V5E97_26780 [Singulisphaera sp. Ch08]|uniref:Uncharacterized protein n=1 Tax=Singulisphaera sp. Ch08 TaxID=3120278 RepID=A0AAU7CAE2_9BACT